MTVVLVKFLKLLIIYVTVFNSRIRWKFNSVLKIKLNSYNVHSLNFNLKFYYIDNHLLFVPHFFHSVKIVNILEDNSHDNILL